MEIVHQPISPRNNCGVLNCSSLTPYKLFTIVSVGQTCCARGLTLNCYPSLIKYSSSCSRVIVPFCPSGLVLGPYDFTFLLILQLSCILHMVPFWESRTKLRVMQIVETDGINMIITKIIAKLELSLDVTICWTRDKCVIILPSY